MADKEYIERGALLKKHPFGKIGGELNWYTEGFLDCVDAAKKAINDAPAADVVEVVRCKDCRLRGSEGCPRMYWECGVLLGITEDNHFCNYGERKEQA